MQNCSNYRKMWKKDTAWFISKGGSIKWATQFYLLLAHLMGPFLFLLSFLASFTASFFIFSSHCSCFSFSLFFLYFSLINSVVSWLVSSIFGGLFRFVLFFFGLLACFVGTGHRSSKVILLLDLLAIKENKIQIQMTVLFFLLKWATHSCKKQGKTAKTSENSDVNVGKWASHGFSCFFYFFFSFFLETQQSFQGWWHCWENHGLTIISFLLWRETGWGVIGHLFSLSKSW